MKKIKTVDGQCTVKVMLDDGGISTAFSYYVDELSFASDELIGKTIDEARQLYHDKDMAYLLS